MSREALQPLIADTKGNIYNIASMEASGMKAGIFFRLGKEEFIKLPAKSRLFMLPPRTAVAYNPVSRNFEAISGSLPFARNKTFFAVAAFVSPGFTVTYNSPYKESGKDKTMLPLFSYAAAAFYKGDFYVAATRVERERRHDPSLIDINVVKKKILIFKSLFPGNRLIKQLADCAITYGCPGAQNLFLSRYEAPLPTSPYCNAVCAGCISYQTKRGCFPSQPRIKFIPTSQEVAEIAIFHIRNVKEPVVSFGQGCEGEPLLVTDIIEDSIRLIRKNTSKGVININTNASKPQALCRLFDAGLDSMRVSINSVRETYYLRYYRPKGYCFKDVKRSIKIAKKKGIFVSLNYLTMPGFTDSKEEFGEFKKFISLYGIDMVQWRNLNFDPIRYFKILKIDTSSLSMLGIKEIMASVKAAFPNIMTGYYNPSRLRRNH